MENQQILTELEAKLSGLLLFSESEAPLTIESFGTIAVPDVKATIAAQNGLTTADLEEVDASEFFDHIVKAADPNSQIMQENALQFQDLHNFLQTNFSNVQVNRVGTESNIPIYITGFLPDGTCTALTSYVIET